MSESFDFNENITDKSYCKFGSKTISNLLMMLKTQIGGVVVNDDIEYIHRMRVASRRIRTSMPLFQDCYPRKKFIRWLNEVKKVTRLLGEARDLDVQIAFIQSYLQKLDSPIDSLGIEPLLRSHKDRRKAIQPTLSSELEELEDRGIIDEMRQFFEENMCSLRKLPYYTSSVLEKAYWHISSRIEDLLSLEEYVHQEDAKNKHHEIRIRAKLLRYTMEAFAPLYETQMKEEIKVLKNFQDLLGEIHDLDVWIDYLSKFTAEKASIKTGERTITAFQNERALLNFMIYIKDKKKKCYEDFVSTWDEKKKEKFFDKLQATANAAYDEGMKKVYSILSNPGLKIAVMSDIHANLHALKAVIQDAKNRGAEVFVNAGDTVGYGAFPNEVLELLHYTNAISVLGNFDCEVLKNETNKKGKKEIAVEFTRKRIAKAQESYLRSFPLEKSITVAGKKVLLVHGSPNSINEHLYIDASIERLEQLADEAKSDFIIVGHSHEQFYKEVNHVFFLNPGSVGRPGDGNPQTAYAILTFKPLKVDLIRIDYNIEAAADALRCEKLPESFSQMILRGISLDDLQKEDQLKKNDMIAECEKIVKLSKEVLQKYWQDNEHSDQVSKIALKFFDKFQPMHQLGKRERCWLECAAILHDGGLSKGTKGHNKESMRIILNDTRLPITSHERRVTASIVRYHRKGPPKRKHYNLATLDAETIRKICVLAGLLRLADALDYSHESLVEDVFVVTGLKQIVIEYFAVSRLPLEEKTFNKKKNLFEETFKKKLLLSWKIQQ